MVGQRELINRTSTGSGYRPCRIDWPNVSIMPRWDRCASSACVRVTGATRSVCLLRTRRHDVSAWLIEQDRRSVLDGTRRAAHFGLANIVTFLNGDATDYATYQRIAPADIVLMCGVWGHVPTLERVPLVRALTALCKARGVVIWTRGISKGLERLHEIQSMFATSSWEQGRVSFTSDKKWAVVIHRYLGLPNTLPTSGRLFHFRTGAGTG